VASSIEGLTPDNVTVADSNGDVLNARAPTPATWPPAPSNNTDRDLRPKLGRLAAGHAGHRARAGNAVVHASAVLDFDQTQITSEMYDPNKQGPSLSNRRPPRDLFGAGASQAAGVGASNVRSQPPHDDSGQIGQIGSAKTTTTVAASTGAAVTTVPSYTQVGSSQQDVVSEVTKSVNRPGSLQQLSLAVVVNSSVKA